MGGKAGYHLVALQKVRQANEHVAAAEALVAAGALAEARATLAAVQVELDGLNEKHSQLQQSILALLASGTAASTVVRIEVACEQLRASIAAANMRVKVIRRQVNEREQQSATSREHLAQSFKQRRALEQHHERWNEQQAKAQSNRED